MRTLVPSKKILNGNREAKGITPKGLGGQYQAQLIRQLNGCLLLVQKLTRQAVGICEAVLDGRGEHVPCEDAGGP